MGLASRGDFSGAKNRSWAGPLARPPGPEKPPNLACQKVVPPPCKNVQKSAFLGEKACIFDHFVHNFAQKWPLFYGHSPPLQGCQSVGKKPTNLYSTKCRIFGPRTPPPVAPWWDTSSRRPPTGSRHPFFQNSINLIFPKPDDGDRISPMTLFCNYLMKIYFYYYNYRDFRFWRIAPRRQHIRTSAEVGSLK
jgi:hypothetical protein